MISRFSDRELKALLSATGICSSIEKRTLLSQWELSIVEQIECVDPKTKERILRTIKYSTGPENLLLEGKVIETAKFYNLSVPEIVYYSQPKSVSFFVTNTILDAQPLNDTFSTGKKAIELLSEFHRKSTEDIEYLKETGLKLQDELWIENLLVAFSIELKRSVKENKITQITEQDLADLSRIITHISSDQIFHDHPITFVHGDFTHRNILLAPPHSSQSKEDYVVFDWSFSRLSYGIFDVVDYILHSYANNANEILQWLSLYCERVFLDLQQLITHYSAYSALRRIHLAAWYLDCALTWIPSEKETYGQLIKELIQQAKRDMLSKSL